MFPNWFGTERGLVVHLVVGIHVAGVAVADQVHVTKLILLYQRGGKPRGVTCVNLKFSLNLNWSLPSFLQFKTGVKSTLTSQIKELGSINTFGIKNWLTWIKSRTKMRQMRRIGVVGDADELLDEVVGSVQQRKRMKIGNDWFSQELEMRKKLF